MADVLQEIVANKRSELEKLTQQLPLSTFKDALTPSAKSLFAALSAPNAGYILECKKASPSKGLIRDVFDLDEIIHAYAPFAAGISVLTDEKYFQGKYEYLQYVTERVSQPVLNKDFFVTEYQVYLARYYNADAVLLMLSVLSDEEYRALASVADALSLDILTEVSNEEEMERAIRLKASIIGINNRDLRDLSTDLATTERLVPMLEKADHEFVVISESGIYTRNDITRLSPVCDGFLVGSALMAQQNLPAAVRALIYGNIKICGLGSVSAAKAAFDAGATLGGLIFAPKSKRAVDLATARNIVEQVPGQYVGVFVNAPLDDVVEAARSLNLSAVQLHGDEDSDYRAQLAQKLPEHCAIWQAIGVGESLPEMLPGLLNEASVAKVLLDCQVGKEKGGTGQQFDWSLLNQIEDMSKIVLAGGVTIDVIDAAQATGAAIIDVNSGVEDAPGVKSADKINALFAHLRQY